MIEFEGKSCPAGSLMNFLNKIMVFLCILYLKGKMLQKTVHLIEDYFGHLLQWTTWLYYCWVILICSHVVTVTILSLTPGATGATPTRPRPDTDNVHGCTVFEAGDGLFAHLPPPPPLTGWGIIIVWNSVQLKQIFLSGKCLLQLHQTSETYRVQGKIIKMLK